MPRRRARRLGPVVELTEVDRSSIDKLCSRWEQIVSYRRDLQAMRDRVMQDLRYSPAGDDPVVNAAVTEEAKLVDAALRSLDSALLRSKEKYRGAFTDELAELLVVQQRSRAIAAHPLIQILLTSSAKERTPEKVLEATRALGLQSGNQLRDLLDGARSADCVIAEILVVSPKTVYRWRQRR